MSSTNEIVDFGGLVVKIAENVIDNTEDTSDRANLQAMLKVLTPLLTSTLKKRSESPDLPLTPKNTPTEEFTMPHPQKTRVKDGVIKDTVAQNALIQVIQTDNVRAVCDLVSVQNRDIYKYENVWLIPISTDQKVCSVFEYICEYGAKFLLRFILSDVDECVGLPLMECFTRACEKKRLDIVQIFIMSNEWDLMHENIYFSNDQIAKQILLILFKSASVSFVTNLPRSQLVIYLKFSTASYSTASYSTAPKLPQTVSEKHSAALARLYKPQ